MPDGSAQRFYHGTIRDFYEFAPHSGFGRIRSRSKGGQDPRTWGIDFHSFSSSPVVAEGYAVGKKSRKLQDAVVMPVYLRGINVLRFDAKGEVWNRFHEGAVQLARRYNRKDVCVKALRPENEFDALCLEHLAPDSTLVDVLVLDNVIDVYDIHEVLASTVFVFEARNIKSALGNCGLYENDTYNITR